VNATEATVTVNGHPASVANRSFAVDVPLAAGDNVLTAVAVDRSGNLGQASVTVHLDPPGAPRIAATSGDHQQAVIGTLLPTPLTAVLLDAAGQPVPGKPVLFAVRGNDGSLDGGKRQIAVLADANGQASAHFTLGTRVGAFNQIVEAKAVGFRGPVFFHATALAGRPALIVVDSGSQQYGIAGRALPRPLVAVVTDAGYNRLPGVPVRFTVTKGAGLFADGSQELVAATDSDGRAIVSWILGPEDGITNNVAEARIEALPDGPLAGFVATGRVAGDPALTTISGIVLDNTDQPVPGATVRILDTVFTAQTDSQGMFKIAGAPVGTVKLIVDGSTTQRPGAWPDLEFVLTTIPGRDNTLGMPIFLLPLNLTGGLLVDETRGGTLTLPDVPGFALEIQPGSVTFPGGGKSGVVSVTVVHNDKVPMVPSFGQQPVLIVTIQPAGARFEPPARLTLPNVEGFAPGQVAEMYSFDHDLGHFVSIGPGTVSEDGSVVTSNHGVGIVKAGWHCCGFPQGTGAPNSCPECTKCDGVLCKPESLCQQCPNGPAGSACDGEGHCRTGRQLIQKICDQLTIESTNHRSFQCPEIPPPQGGPGTCGGALEVFYTKVSHSCDGVDLNGAIIDEDVTADHKCTQPQFEPAMEDKFEVKAGNDISGNIDQYSLCNDLSGIPVPYDCTETFTQHQKIDNCIRTVIITFHIVRTSASCSGTVTRQ
jgi:Carboxypeptidase regulatory-like domain/Glucodextranase, domain B